MPPRAASPSDWSLPEVGEFFLKLPSDKLFGWATRSNDATEDVSAVYQAAYQGTKERTGSHPHPKSGVGAKKKGRICPECSSVPDQPLPKQILKWEGRRVHILFNPLRDDHTRVVEVFGKIFRNHVVRNAFAELHHPLHVKRKVMGCRACGTLPYEKAIFLFARRYRNCLEFSWVRDVLKDWRSSGKRGRLQGLIRNYSSPPLGNRLDREYIRVWQAVELERRSKAAVEVELRAAIQLVALQTSPFAGMLTARARKRVKDYYYRGRVLMYDVFFRCNEIFAKAVPNIVAKQLLALGREWMEGDLPSRRKMAEKFHEAHLEVLMGEHTQRPRIETA